MAGAAAVTGPDPGVPECRPEDLAVSVEWAPGDDGGLHGAVVVANTGGRACRLSGKPSVSPLDADGRRLGTSTVVTLEFRVPGYVVVPPGGRARARVSWPGWAGPPAADRAVVRWGPGGDRTEVAAPVRGPVQPTRTEQPHTLTSSWFDLDR